MISSGTSFLGGIYSFQKARVHRQLKKYNKAPQEIKRDK